MFRFSARGGLLAALLLLALPSVVLAAPADLDPSFGTSGVTVTPVTQGGTPLASLVRDVVAQPDGNLLWVGGRYNGGNWEWMVGRYTADGALDPAFNGGNGFEDFSGSLSFPAATGQNPVGGALAVAVEAGTGRIDVSGQTTGTNAPVTVLQAQPGGAAYGPYGTAGLASVPVSGSSATTVHALALQPDGKLVAAGEAFVSGNSVPFVARFNTDGTADGTFSPSGALYEIPAAACDNAIENCNEGGLALATTVASVDAIYIGGSDLANLVGGRVWKLVPGIGGFAIDSSYGDPSTPGGAQIERHAVNEVDALILQGTSVVVAGYAENAQNSKSCGIARVGATGQQDTSFGAHIDVGGTCTARDLAVDSGGRYVFSGESYSGTQSTGTLSLAAGRWTTAGQPDTAFAAGGGAALSPGGSPAFGEAVLMQADKPVVAGAAGSPDHSLMIARLAGGDLPAGSGGTGGTGGGGGGGTTTAPTSKPVATTPPSIGGRTPPFKLGATLSCQPGTWAPAGVTITGYQWYRYAFTTSASPFASAPTLVGSAQTYRVVAADQGQMLACSATATNAAGSTTTQSPRAAVTRRLKIPASIRGRTLAQAQTLLRHLYGGQVSFGTARERARAGTAKAAIPCEFGGEQEQRTSHCTDSKTGSIRPGRVFNSTPPIGHYVDEAYGSGKLPKIVLDWYDSSKDKTDDVPNATPKVKCPVADGANVRQDFENRVLGHYAQYARSLLAQYNCPFGETTKYVTDQSVDPYVSELQTKRFDGELGYQLTIATPKVSDLGAVVYHRRLHGLDSFQGANLARGPLNPGLGSDGRLTVVRGGQKNDLCFHVFEVSTGRAVPGALVYAYAPNGSEDIDMQGKRDYIRTDSDGDGCTSFQVREPGGYRFAYTYYGANGTNEEGAMTIPAVDRGTAKWTTISGREMQCNAAQCTQLGFASSRRAHAASVLSDIGALFHNILAGLFGRSSPVVSKGGTQDAATSDGSPSATLYHAQADNGVTPGVLVVKGTVRIISNDGASLISNDGGSLISNDGGSVISEHGMGLLVKTSSLISNDGGSLVALGSAQGVGRPAINSASSVVAVRDGRIISNDGASLISNDGGSIVSTSGSGLTAPAGGAVVMYGNRAVIAAANGVIPRGTLISNDGGSAIPLAGTG